eukprot:2780299-Rhodomonas_salina.2
MLLWYYCYAPMLLVVLSGYNATRLPSPNRETAAAALRNGFAVVAADLDQVRYLPTRLLRAVRKWTSELLGTDADVRY